MDRKRPVDTQIGQRLKEYRQHRGMTVRELADAALKRSGRIIEHRYPFDRWCNLFEQFHPFAGHGRLDAGESGNVAAGTGEARNESLRDWIGLERENDWDRGCRPDRCSDRNRVACNDDVRRECDDLRDMGLI